MHYTLTCQQCGGTLEASPDARRVKCEYCGAENIVFIYEVNCPECNYLIKFKDGYGAHILEGVCPNCRIPLRLSGHVVEKIPASFEVCSRNSKEVDIEPVNFDVFVKDKSFVNSDVEWRELLIENITFQWTGFLQGTQRNEYYYWLWEAHFLAHKTAGGRMLLSLHHLPMRLATQSAAFLEMIAIEEGENVAKHFQKLAEQSKSWQESYKPMEKFLPPPVLKKNGHTYVRRIHTLVS